MKTAETEENTISDAIRQKATQDAFASEDDRVYLTNEIDLVVKNKTPYLVCNDPNLVFSYLVQEEGFSDEESVITGSDDTFVSIYTKYAVGEPSVTVYFRWKQRDDYRFYLNLTSDIWHYPHPVFSGAYVENATVGL